MDLTICETVKGYSHQTFCFKGSLQPQNKFYLDERSLWLYLRTGIGFLEIFLVWEKLDFVCRVSSSTVGRHFCSFVLLLVVWRHWVIERNFTSRFLQRSLPPVRKYCCCFFGISYNASLHGSKLHKQLTQDCGDKLPSSSCRKTSAASVADENSPS